MISSGPHLPNTQGLTNTSFQTPPLDRSLWKSVPQLIDSQAEKNPDHSLFIYNTPNGGNCVVTLSQYARMIHGMARRVREEVGGRKGPVVVAILAIVDSISFVTVSMSIIRAGFIPLSISPQNSPDGLAYLLSEANAQFIYASDDRRTQSLIADAFALLLNSPPTLLDIPTYSLLEKLGRSSQGLLEPMETPDLDSVAMILHSSGSTSQVAKLMKITHRIYMEWASIPFYGDVDVCGETLAAQPNPMFHAMGPISAIWPVSVGITVAFFRPAVPPIVPTPNVVMQDILETDCTLIVTVPSFLEAWSKFEDGMNMLRSMKRVLFLGAPLPRDVGNLLSERGVALNISYASMETGAISRMFKNVSNPADWEYLEFPKEANILLIPASTESETESQEAEVYVPLVLNSASQTVVISNTEVDGVLGFKMNDMIQRHPEIKTMYRPYGRIDDQVVLSTGLKVNCAPIESYVRSHPKIAFGVMFGNAKPSVGIILQLHPEFAFEPEDASLEAMEEHREDVWQTLVDAVQGAQMQSRIARKMILFASPSKPFPLTAKNNPRRTLVLQAYQKEITELYKM